MDHAGSGKTTVFRTEEKRLGDSARFVTARNFLVYDTVPEEWRGKTLFIDGLDEVRAGYSDVRRPFDQIRKQLVKLGKPQFRISCREADWLGANDRLGLEHVSKDEAVTVLRLDPLTPQDTAAILATRLGVSDPWAFIVSAHEQGVGGLLSNAQGLQLLAKAVSAAMPLAVTSVLVAEAPRPDIRLRRRRLA